MRFAYSLGAPGQIMKKFQIGATQAYAGVPVVKGGSNTKGITLATTTAAVGMVGVTSDTATLVTAQQSDKSDTARYVTVNINPLAVYKARLSGGATENTALTKYPVTTANTDGLSVTTGTDWSSPTYDEGVIWGYDGANTGVGRKITSVSSTAATVLVAFPVVNVVGDNYLAIPYCAAPFGYETHYVQLTTNLYQLDASQAVNTSNVNLRVVELELRDSGQQGTTASFAYVIANGHVFSAGLVV